MKLSVLISIYYKENPIYFDKAMESIWDIQTLKPNEIILVEDGPLTNALYDVIKKWKTILQSKLKVIKLEKNIGTGGAKAKGLQYCSGDYIAIMDTDDIATPNRFKKQIEFLENNKDIDVVGTYIQEIDENENVVKDVVKFPLTHSELYYFFSKRDPIAHPTSMFRKRYFEKAGGYRSDLHLAEDTLLWYYGFKNGAIFANIDFIGLKFRRSKEFYKRRANVKKSVNLLKFRLFRLNRDLNYGIKADIYAILYFIILFSPRFIKKFVYNKLR